MHADNESFGNVDLKLEDTCFPLNQAAIAIGSTPMTGEAGYIGRRGCFALPPSL